MIFQWGMIGVILIIFIIIPESPWWLASKGKVDGASKVLHRCYGRVEGYDVAQQIVGPLPFGPQLRMLGSCPETCG